MRLFVTISEGSPELAVDAIRALNLDHDGVEIRIERFSSFDPGLFRAATEKPIILTRRGSPMTSDDLQQALDAGIDLVDVEFTDGLEWLVPVRDRVILSHHDFDGMPDMEDLLRQMRRHGCAHTKLAVTPRTLSDNLRLLELSAPGTTLIGMGERGLYSRLLAPFLGSELAFVSPSVERGAAPGQIPLARALEIYGPDRASLKASEIFAVAGNPAGHSLSPSIHNALFRSRKVPAAYTIASVGSFAEVAEAFLDGAVNGLSITAPFKEEAFTFAEQHGAAIGENARASGAVNTLVTVRDGILADNTDVDGFTRILARLCGRDRKTVALAGAGGTARAAAVALERAGMNVIVFNRSEKRGRELAETLRAEYRPLDALAGFDGEIVINTLADPSATTFRFTPGMTYIEAAYGEGRLLPRDGVEWIDGLELLHAQAIRQHELFMKVYDGP